jgi:predicted amidohydrolase
MIRIGIVQMQSIPLKVNENLSLAESLIMQAVRDGAQLVVLPEMFNVGFYFGEELMHVAETLNGKTVAWLKGIAAKENIYITSSIYEYYQDHYYNTMVMVGNDGSVQFYRKRNPTWFEVSVWRRSDEPGPGIFDTPFGRIGGVICFDSFSRETFEGFRKSGVDLIIIVACWGTSQLKIWRPDIFLAYSALQEWGYLATGAVPSHFTKQLNVPTVLVNQGGCTFTPCETPRFYPLPPLGILRYDFWGKSSIRDSTGRILVRANGNETDFCAVETIELNPLSKTRPTARVDIPKKYLDSNYYFVQPPLVAKIFQVYFSKGLQAVYESRRLQNTTHH